MDHIKKHLYIFMQICSDEEKVRFTIHLHHSNVPSLDSTFIWDHIFNWLLWCPWCMVIIPCLVLKPHCDPKTRVGKYYRNSHPSFIMTCSATQECWRLSQLTLGKTQSTPWASYQSTTGHVRVQTPKVYYKTESSVTHLCLWWWRCVGV